MSKKSRKPRPNQGRTTGQTRGPAAPPPAPAARSFMPMIAAGVAILIVVVAGIFLFQGDDDDDGGDPTATTQALAAPTTAPAGSAATPAASENPATPEDAADAAVRQLVPDVSGELLTVLPAGSIYVPGTQRFAVGLVDENDLPFEQGTAEFMVLKLSGTTGTISEVLPAPFYPYGLEESHAGHDDADHAASSITGIFAARATFDAPGPWGLIAKVTLPDGTVRAGQATFNVEPDSDVPAWGEPAPASKSLTATTPEEAAEICSADVPDTMHALSIDQAIASGKPTVVLFATPAYCATRTCGPSLEAMSELQRRYGDSVNFIHIEIYPGGDTSKPVGTFDEWHLATEPWAFFLDAQGTIVERFDGGLGLTELDPAVRQLAGLAVRQWRDSSGIVPVPGPGIAA